MRRQVKIALLAAVAFMLCAFTLTIASAQTPPIKLNLTVSKTVYQPGEPISVQIRLMNDSGSQVIAQEGFSTQSFYLMITFTDPDGNPVYTKYQDVGLEGGPPVRFQDRDAVFVEAIEAGTIKTDILDDARTFYNITKSGRWKARVKAQLETYSAATAYPDTGKLLSYLEDQTGSYVVESNETSFEIVPTAPPVWSPVKVSVSSHIVGTGTKPSVKKNPLSGAQVRLYSRPTLAQYNPANWKYYSLIWNDNSLTPAQVRTTDSNGIALFDQVAKGSYILITTTDGEVFAGSPIDADDTDWGKQTIEKHLTFMEKSDKSKVPAKTSVQRGSLLLITEPEYIEWDSAQELYPFVFEALGDWSVTTAISPPEGFTADYSALSVSLKNKAGAVQFLVREIGSRWIETNVTFSVTHKKKVKVLKGNVGIKLDRKLAEKKRLSIYGETGGPGIFSGGRKIGD